MKKNLVDTFTKILKKSFMLCFKVYWPLTIGEDTPKTTLVLWIYCME